MNVHHINVMPADQGPHLPQGFEAEHRPEGQQQLLQRAPLGVGALIGDDLMAVGLQHGPLRLKDSVLPAGQPVAAVDKQNTVMRLFRHGGDLLFQSRGRLGQNTSLLYRVRAGMGRDRQEIK